MNMDIAVAIQTLEGTYKTSVDSIAVETMILKLIQKVRVSAVFAFVSFILLLSIAGMSAHVKELKPISDLHHKSLNHRSCYVLTPGIMNDGDMSQQIQQMVRFIRQEAEEKANEISLSAEEEFNIEKLQLVEIEKRNSSTHIYEFGKTQFQRKKKSDL